MSSPRAVLNARVCDGEPPNMTNRNRHEPGRSEVDVNVVCAESRNDFRLIVASLIAESQQGSRGSWATILSRVEVANLIDSILSSCKVDANDFTSSAKNPCSTPCITAISLFIALLHVK
jgi:hypothetical protein